MTYSYFKKFILFMAAFIGLHSLQADPTSLAEEGIDVNIRKAVHYTGPSSVKAAVTEHHDLMANDATLPATALVKLVEDVQEKPIAPRKKRDCCAKCWSGFTRCFKKTTDYTKWFLDQVEEYYPLAKQGFEKALVWSEDFALFFGNPELATKIKDLQTKGGRYAELAERYLEMAANSSLLLKKVSEALSLIKFEGQDDFFAQVRNTIPTIFSLASDVKNGSYAYQNAEGDLEFFVKRGDENPALHLSLDETLLDLLATDFEEYKADLGFQDSLATWRNWKKSFNAKQLGIGAQMKDVFIRLGDAFSKITAVELDQDTGTVSFFPPSKKDAADKEPVFVLTVPGFDQSWSPAETPKVSVSAEERGDSDQATEGDTIDFTPPADDDEGATEV